jgi:FAD/FMN-containing dehydrogenase/DNA-binding HxlR family transcriptional regulator
MNLPSGPRERSSTESVLFRTAPVGEGLRVMRGYGQFCPIARASEVLAERWTPIILRNLLLGCKTFNEISSGAPGLSRALLTKRLRELQRARVIEITPKPGGHGSLYEVTPSGRELWGVLVAMGDWAEKWKQVSPEHADPDMVLWSWCHGFMRRDLLPDRRVSIRFEFKIRQHVIRVWLLIENRDAELCSFDPGFEEDAVVTIEDHLAFARWHLGLVKWGTALRSGGIRVQGKRNITRALPTWNAGPHIHVAGRERHTRPPEPPRVPLDIRGLPKVAHPTPANGGERPARRSQKSIPGFEGRVMTPADADYEQARAVWNGAIDRRPRYIARCTGPTDVAAALRFARERDLPLSVRGGGHSVAGTSVCDDGVMIDLAPMKALQVDPGARIARAGAGLVWGELDAATQAFGLATTGGVMSETGVAGLTLGGGIGHLMRRYGLTVDNLLSADVVLADGRTVTANAGENAELFWALRGGGGNFGIATSFTYRLHPVGPDVFAGQVIWALEDAPNVLRFYREFAALASREVGTALVLRKAPPAPFLPVELHRRPVCMVAMSHLGGPEAAERALEPMRTFGRPLLDLVGPRPYTGLQTAFNATAPAGWHYYWKSMNLPPFEDSVIDTIVDHCSQIGSPWSYVLISQLGGAIADADGDATAYSDRTAAHNININGVWLPHEPMAEQETRWTREFFASVEPHQTGAYVNFLDRDDQDRVRAAYGEDTYRRLATIKDVYDPDNVFRLNHNIKPSRASAGSVRALETPALEREQTGATPRGA